MASTSSVISIPVSVHVDHFKWQLDLFWYSHLRVYGDAARDKAKAIVIKRNVISEPKHERLEWDTDIPHVMCESFFDYFGETTPTNHLHKPLNIQVGLSQIIDQFADDQIVELLDCDMFHLRPYREADIDARHLIVCDIYETWHLGSLSTYRPVIEMFFENGGRFYNGGFVPIIGRVAAFKRVLPHWIAVHRQMLSMDYPKLIHWWAGMYALQAACEKTQVQMVAEDCCYFPSVNDLRESHHVCHYSCDRYFDKNLYPRIDPATFDDNLFYRRVREWPNFLK